VIWLLTTKVEKGGSLLVKKEKEKEKKRKEKDRWLLQLYILINVVGLACDAYTLASLNTNKF
jgi:hypothetical protein